MADTGLQFFGGGPGGGGDVSQAELDAETAARIAADEALAESVGSSSAADIAFTPESGIAGTDVQAALGREIIYYGRPDDPLSRSYDVELPGGVFPYGYNGDATDHLGLYKQGGRIWLFGSLEIEQEVMATLGAGGGLLLPLPVGFRPGALEAIGQGNNSQTVGVSLNNFAVTRSVALYAYIDAIYMNPLGTNQGPLTAPELAADTYVFPSGASWALD